MWDDYCFLCNCGLFVLFCSRFDLLFWIRLFDAGVPACCLWLFIWYFVVCVGCLWICLRVAALISPVVDLFLLLLRFWALLDVLVTLGCLVIMVCATGLLHIVWVGW